jgi:hypothetical protein
MRFVPAGIGALKRLRIRAFGSRTPFRHAGATYSGPTQVFGSVLTRSRQKPALERGIAAPEVDRRVVAREVHDDQARTRVRVARTVGRYETRSVRTITRNRSVALA